MDDWQFVPLLEKTNDGTLTFQDLWAPHDEHRLLLPRIIIIISMFATGVITESNLHHLHSRGSHISLSALADGAPQR
jgi:hypothetical protein